MRITGLQHEGSVFLLIQRMANMQGTCNWFSHAGDVADMSWSIAITKQRCSGGCLLMQSWKAGHHWIFLGNLLRIRVHMRRQTSPVHSCPVWSLNPLRNLFDNLLWLYRKLRPFFPCGVQFRALFLCFQHTGSSFPYTFFVDSFLTVSVTQWWVRLIPLFPSKPFTSVSLQATKVISFVQIQHWSPLWDFQ